jgi:ABC-type uncharacterized transport system substrate-binding protein
MKRREFITLLGGAAAAWPLAAHAQRAGKIPTVGVLWHAGSAEEEGPYFKALLEGFRDLGYLDGQNIKLEHRFPNEMHEQFRTMAAELVALKVDVLVTVGTASAPYARNATTTIPVVFTLVTDPVATRLVESLARPGGNVTGFSTYGAQLTGKRFQLIKEIVPGLSRVALLVNPNEQPSRLHVEEGRAAAGELGLDLRIFEVRSLDELEPAFEAMAKDGIQATILGSGSLLFQGKETIAKLALAARLPTCAWSKETLQAGALAAYGPDYPAVVRRASVYVDKILKGAKPSDLPVEQPTKFQLLINLKTAKALGLEIPAMLLARADEVIE